MIRSGEVTPNDEPTANEEFNERELMEPGEIPQTRTFKIDGPVDNVSINAGEVPTREQLRDTKDRINRINQAAESARDRINESAEAAKGKINAVDPTDRLEASKEKRYASGPGARRADECISLVKYVLSRPEFMALSDYAIARLCVVDSLTVAQVRREFINNLTAGAQR